MTPKIVKLGISVHCNLVTKDDFQIESKRRFGNISYVMKLLAKVVLTSSLLHLIPKLYVAGLRKEESYDSMISKIDNKIPDVINSIKVNWLQK